jgi:hypothetical protein
MQLSRAHKKARMTRETPSDFASHDQWLAHVSREIPVPEQPYALAFGRMELFRRFYRMQGLRSQMNSHMSCSGSRQSTTLSGPSHWRP